LVDHSKTIRLHGVGIAPALVYAPGPGCENVPGPLLIQTSSPQPILRPNSRQLAFWNETWAREKRTIRGNRPQQSQKPTLGRLLATFQRRLAGAVPVRGPSSGGGPGGGQARRKLRVRDLGSVLDAESASRVGSAAAFTRLWMPQSVGRSILLRFRQYEHKPRTDTTGTWLWRSSRKSSVKCCSAPVQTA